ncbi:AAA family ATPase [Alkalibaculum sp. M08DMB]|uniref:AAA family ATPase n=1 Tax=Alkalibaculum sporogenes TaxID=2655001 RepID=A0A6A7K5A6_9FIRM|nr:AAA family ATPase [Alkalibaculum sporogenes]
MKALQFSKYTRIYFESRHTETYENSRLSFVKSALAKESSNNIFQYFKEIAHKVSLKTDDGTNILGNRYKKIDFIRPDSVLASYLSGEINEKKDFRNLDIIYPFGFNASQKQAVENAMNNQVSIVEGPPGTGKTQTILNIVANAVIKGKSIAVVSSNNEATKNVFDKLAKNDVSFIAAYLGSGKNKQEFVDSQSGCLPEFSGWERSIQENEDIQSKLLELAKNLDVMLVNKNQLSALQQEQDVVLTEKEHFEEYYDKINQEQINIKARKILKPKAVLKLLIELENRNVDSRISFFRKVAYAFKYGIWDKSFYLAENSVRIAICQKLFYTLKISELKQAVNKLENELEHYNFIERMNEYSELSMKLFKSYLHKKYAGMNERKLYKVDDLWKNSEEFIINYPVVLSTTYSLRSSLSSKLVYDYVIVDEASQVDLATGVLALSCAKNTVIVGDLNQLPNVIKDETKKETNSIFERYNLSAKYNYSMHSLLSSVSAVFEDVERIMLREHYRCHPKIIGFCNQKFYDNQLIILTEPKTDKEPLVVYKTVAGNHSRDRMNLRQIDVIEKEVIPEQKLNVDIDSIGIVTPYRNQTEHLQQVFKNTKVKADTVDKFQGQERNIVILSTVDDEITDFTDDPNRLNVAVSRAIDQLIVVTDGNDPKRNTNIGDLIGYIKYNNCEIIDSKLYSIFDYLYKYYEEQRKVFLRKTKRVSEYDSENLMYGLIMEVLQGDFRKYDVAVHVPLRMIVRESLLLTNEENRYVLNENTHVDFLIYSKIVHQPVLVIEVDGYEFHKAGTVQIDRDIKKNAILEKSKLPYIRFATNGSEEKEKLYEKLKSIL